MHKHKPDVPLFHFHSVHLAGFSATEFDSLICVSLFHGLPLLSREREREQMQIGMSVRVMNMQVTDGKKKW